MDVDGPSPGKPEAVSAGIAVPPGFFAQRVRQARYYHLNLTPTGREDLTVVCGGVEHCQPDYVMQRDGFQYVSIEFVAAGCGQLVLNGKTHALRPGVAFSYGPGIPHRITTDPKAPMTKYFVDFAGRRARALVRRFGPLQRGVVQVSDPLAIVDIYEGMHRSALAGSPQSTRICLLLLQMLVLRVAELGTDRLNRNERALQTYRRCRACIETESGTLRTLTDIARMCHMNPSYLCRVFRRFAGSTPYKYLMRQKMNQAADRLQHSDMLVKEVADELGFPDPFHFSRSFKAVHSIAPQRFIALNRRR